MSFSIYNALENKYSKHIINGEYKISTCYPPLVYVKISDNLVKEIFNSFRELTELNYLKLGKKKSFTAVLPPYFLGAPNSFDNPLGAHVTVVTSREISEFPLTSSKFIDLEGKHVNLQCLKIQKVKPTFWKAMEKIWIFSIPSWELSNHRFGRGLSRLPNGKKIPWMIDDSQIDGQPNGHAFHFTFAVKPKNTNIPSFISTLPSATIKLSQNQKKKITIEEKIDDLEDEYISRLALEIIHIMMKSKEDESKLEKKENKKTANFRSKYQCWKRSCMKRKIKIYMSYKVKNFQNNPVENT